MRSQTTRCPASSTTAIATLKPSACALAKPRSTLSRARARVSAMSGDLDPDLAALDRDRVGDDRPAPRGHQAGPGFEVEHPPVPWTGQAGARQPSLTERTTLMDTLVGAREDVVVDARQHDPGAIGLHQGRLTRPEFLQAGDAAPTHISSFATKAR